MPFGCCVVVDDHQRTEDLVLRRILSPITAVILLGLTPLLGAAGASAAGFDDSFVASIARPVALAFTPDGRLLVTGQAGRLWVYDNGNLSDTPALDLTNRICSNSERGLLGVAVDPAFASNHRIYLYYTYKKHGVCDTNTSKSPVNRVSRFILNNTNVVSRRSEVILVDNIPSPNGNHNGGDLHFGKDGYLYISVGDGGCDYRANSGCQDDNDAARDQHVLLGKILRITSNGGIPATNPFRGSDSARCNSTGRTSPGMKCRETFARGLRNPFRMAFDPNDSRTRFFINDVGGGKWEEIDVGRAGADYGWNIREGFCSTGSTSNCGRPPAGMTNPIHSYAHSTGCESITGGAFVPNGVWPARYSGVYLFADYVCGKMFKLERSSQGGYQATTFASSIPERDPISMAFDPYRNLDGLFYTTLGGAREGEVRRITYIAD